MSVTRISSRSLRLNKEQKLTVAGVSTLAAAALAYSLVPEALCQIIRWHRRSSPT